MKRFYKTAAVAERDGGFAVLLDGKPIETPAARPLVAPNAALAERIAKEWSEQGEHVRPSTMPLTQLLSTAIDRMGDARLRAEAVAEIAGYAETDLVCFRAAHPPALVLRQEAAWQPLLEWTAERYGAKLGVTVGFGPPGHAPAALTRIEAAVAAAGPLGLAALHLATGTLGSAVIALALAEGRLCADEAFRIAYLDELHQMEVWGEDAEAKARLERIRADIAATAEFLSLVAKSS